ncbi:MAG: phytoene desaturase family protein [Candidatus Kapaibacterium sp.]
MKKKVAVIGSGLGGLSAALYLSASDEYDITIFEKNSYAGGKLGEISSSGFRFDTGPSVLTMIEVIGNLFSNLSLNIHDYLDFKRLNTANRNFFSDGRVIDTFSDSSKFKQEIGKVCNTSADNLNAFYNHLKGIYDRTANIFLFTPIHEISYLLKQGKIPNLFDFTKIEAFSTIDKVVGRYFPNPNIQQLFSRYATYNGSSPYSAPGTLSMIAYVELVMGSYYVDGGIYKISQVLGNIARNRNIKLHLNTKVEKIVVKSGTAAAIKVNGIIEEFDYIISNADVVYTFDKMIDEYERFKSRLLRNEPSLSGMVYLWGVNKSHDILEHHNVFYSGDYKKEFDSIFNHLSVPDDPTVYVAITSKQNSNHAPVSMENWFVLLNMPYIDNQDWDYEKFRMKEIILRKLNNHGIDVANKIIYEKIMTPRDLYYNYYSNKGSIYGISSNSMFSAFKRHPNRSRIVKNLYFAGASVHPGGGIPLVILSGKHAAEIINSHIRKIL